MTDTASSGPMPSPGIRVIVWRPPYNEWEKSYCCDLVSVSNLFVTECARPETLSSLLAKAILWLYILKLIKLLLLVQGSYNDNCTCVIICTQIICGNETHHNWSTRSICLQEETKVAKRLTLDKRRINQFRLCRVAMAYKPYGTMVSLCILFMTMLMLTQILHNYLIFLMLLFTC